MSTSQRTWLKYLVFNGTTTGIANGSSSAYLADDFQNIVLEVTASANTTLTIKVVGSNYSPEDNTSLTEEYPNFGAADSQTNPWSYISIIDLDSRTAIPGSTGTTYTAQAGTRKFNIETNQVRWIGLEISGYSAGSVRALLSMVDNR